MKQINYYLWKLKYFEANRISNKQVDANNIPDCIWYNKASGQYWKIETDRPVNDELDRFLRIKNSYNINIIRICVVICTVFFVMAMISTI
ncbi:MAG: hypothetical protein RIN55_08250 [Tissierellaceae bacterium]|nr:hypothetical protein [Tissierellaceae bacterium]